MVDLTETLRGAGEIVAGRFRIRRLLGAGGMGCVWEAEHIHLRRRVALKFLRRAERIEGGLDRFEREARAASALANEHVVQVLDFGYTDNGAPYLAMELLEGQSLGTLVEKGPLPLARAADLVAQACSGLHAAHEAGLVHCDLKPENLFVCRRPDGTDLVKVLDFGVVQVRGDESERATGIDERDSWGTPSYMSPEQARGGAVLDRRSDVYALGAVLFELITGQRAYEAETAEQTIDLILTKRPPSVAKLRDHVPAALERVVTRSMARSAKDRFPTALAMAEALRPFASSTRASASLRVPSGATTERTRRHVRSDGRAAGRLGLLITVGAIGGSAAAWVWFEREARVAPELRADAAAVAPAAVPAPAPVTPVRTSEPAPPAVAPAPRPRAPRRRRDLPLLEDRREAAAPTAPPPATSRFERTNPYAP